MKKVSDFEQVQSILKENDAVLLYFSGESCSVCKVLKPKITQSFTETFPKIKLIEIPTDEALETTAKFGVFSLPIMILYVEQKEFLKRGRNVSVPLFIEEVRRIYELYFGSDK